MNSPESTPAPDFEPGIDKRRPVLMRIILPAVITAAGIGIAFFFLTTRPEPAVSPPERTARLVEVTHVSPTDHRIEIEAMGVVEAKSEIQLKPRVSGQILEESDELIPGRTFKKDAMLFRIDRSDYELALQTQEANDQQAQASYLIEQGQQTVAKADYEMTGQTLTGSALDLVLRKPQLMQAEATAQSANAQLEVAKLNLSRTEIVAPFDALILSKSETVGSIVNTSSTLATLADCSEFWVELEIPVRDTRWIDTEAVEDENQHVSVEIYDELGWGKGVSREGELISMSHHVDDSSKMVNVTVAVKDPLSLLPENQDEPKLMLGAFIRAKIQGKELHDVIVLKRDYLRLDNIVWTLDDQNRLVFTPVDLEYSGAENVVLSGSFDSKTKIVTSNLSVPVEGMLLRYEEPVADATSGNQN